MDFKVKQRISPLFSYPSQLSGLFRQAVLVVALAVSALLAGCQSDQPSGPPPTTLAGSKPTGPVGKPPLQIGDQIELLVAEDNQFNGTYRVREDGDVILPKLGRVVVKGLTTSQAESVFKSALEKSQLVRATVLVDRISSANAGPGGVEGGPSISVILTGSVARPGQHKLAVPASGIGLYEAVMIGGGLGRYAEERKVSIMRKQADQRRTTFVVDLAAIKAGKSPDVPLQEGDIVNVPEKAFVF